MFKYCVDFLLLNSCNSLPKLHKVEPTSALSLRMPTNKMNGLACTSVVICYDRGE